MKKRRQISFFLIASVVIFGVAIVGWFNLANRNVKAAWFNDDWGYRKSITLTVTSSSSDITNLETLLTIDTTGITAKLNTNCEDLRFTAQNGKTLPYFIDTCSDNSATNKVWVMVDLVPKNTTTYTMYMYYGNSTAVSASDSTTFWRVNGLYGYWKMNESSWTVDCSTSSVKDSSAKGYNGKSCPTSTGPAGGATGQYGNAGLFDGSNDYVATSDITQLNSASKFTMSVWFKRRLAGSIVEVTKYLSSSNYLNFEPWSDGRVYITFNNAGSASDMSFASNDTNWHHTVVVYDGTLSAGNRVLMFLDGVSQSLTPSGTIPATTPNMSGGTFEIGRSQQGAIYTDGTIDEVRLYNRAFTSAEAANLYTDPGTTATISDSISNPTTAFATEETGSGPVGYWKFNEGQGTVANDTTSNNGAGTLSGTNKPTWQTEDQCISGKCLYFEGTTANVSIPDSTVLRPSTFTVSTWVNYTLTPHDTALIAKRGSGTTQTFELYLNSGDTLSGSVSDGATTVSLHNAYLLSRGWHFVAMSWDGSTMKLYADGRLVASKTQAITIAFGAYPVLIGIDSVNSAFFTGFMDEPKLYNYVRTDAQIKLDYNANLKEGGGTSLGSDPRNAKSLSNGMVGYWKLNESSSTRADSSGYAYTLSDWNTVTSNPGKFAKAGQFTRANSESLYVADNANLSVTGDYTISGWFYQDTNTSGDRCIICKADVFNSKREFLLLRATSGPLQFYISNDGTNTTSVTSSEFSNTASVWNFVVAWYDSSKKTINIQINGGKVDSVDFASTPYDSDSQFMIGGTGNTLGTALSFFDGRIDDVRVYKRVLSQADRQLLYNFAPGPDAYWPMEESGGSRVDTVGGLSLSVSAGNVYSVPGKFGKAAYFPNVSGDYLSKTDDATLSMGDMDFTVEAWMYMDNKGDHRSIVSKATGTTDAATEYLLYYNFTSDRFAWKISNGTTTTTLIDTALGSPVAGRWYHLAGWYDSFNNLTGITINGNLTTTSSNSTGSQDTAGTFSVGSYFGTSHHGGGIDDVRIYRYLRSTKQIVEDMNAGHPAGGSPVGSQVGFWKFDEGQGTTAHDSSPNGFDLTLTGMSSPASVGISGWNPNGRVNKALSFDGSNDKAAVTTNSALSITGQLTVSAWIKMQSTGLDERVFISKWNSTGNQRGMAFTLNVSDKACLSLDSDGAAGGIDTACSNTTLVKNTWYHVAAVYTPSTSIKIYLNGKLDGILDTGIDSAIFANTADFQVGGSASGWNNLFTGDIDEVKLYNYALTPAEILIDYNQGQGIKFGSLGASTVDGKTASNSAASVYCVPGDTSVCRPPVAEWNLEEGSGGSAYDTSGNANTGTWAGTGTRYTGAGAVGKAGVFNGTDDSISVNDATVLRPAALTLSAWVYYTKNDTDQVFIQKGNGVSSCTLGRSFSLGMNFPAPNFTITDGSGYNFAGAYNLTIPINTWVQEVGTYDGSAINIYYNGVLFDSKPASRTISYNANSLLIGSGNCNGSSTPTSFFAGRIDHVKLYDYARTPAQVAYDYNKGKPMIWWKFDECQGSVANDSGVGYPGTVYPGSSGSHTTVGTCSSSGTTMRYDGRNGKYNYGLNFDGTDDYVSVASPSGSPTDQTPSFMPHKQGTVSLWVYPTSAAAQDQAVVSATDKDTSQQNEWFVDFVNDYSIAIFNIKSGSTTARLTSDANSWVLNAWNSVIVTSDGSTTKLYLNGKLMKLAVTTGSNNGDWFGDIANLDNLTVGGGLRNNVLVGPVTGNIDDVQLFTYPLTDYQARLLYNQGSAVRFGPTSGTP